MEQMTFLDFFAGIGGFRKGFELCGMRCVGHCEIDKYADRSYRAIHDVKEDEWYAADITKVAPADLPRADLWAGGFPCQDISVAGRQRGLDGARSGLFFTLAQLVKGQSPENRPTWIVLENVKNLLSIHGGWDFATVLYSLAELGYHIEYGLLNSKFHGVPQNRERVYIVAYRHFRTHGGRKIFPVECGDSKALIRLIDGCQGKRVYDSSGISCTLTSSGGGFAGKTGLYFIEHDCSHVRNAALIDLCSGNPKVTNTARCIKAKYNSGITNRTADNSGVLCISDSCSECSDGVMVQDKNGICLCSCDNCNRSLKVKCATRQGYDEARCGDGIVLSFPNSKNRRGRVGHGVVQTLDTACNQGIAFVRCGRIRRLTPRECWRLQGFSDDMFEKAAAVTSNHQLYRQAGNSVTIPVVYAVGQRIIEIERQLAAERCKSDCAL